MMKLPRRILLLTCVLFAPVSFALQNAAAPPNVGMGMGTGTPVLDHIRKAHLLTCAVSKEEEDYSRATDHGNRALFDIDMCKAVAVAILGPGARFDIHVFSDEPGAVAALEKSEVDMIASASPSVANTAKGFVFSRPTFYDGQGFLLKNDPAVHSPLDLAGKKICFLIETPAERGLHAYAAAHGISYIWYPFSEAGEMEAAFFGGNCAAITGDVSQLANDRGIYPKRLSEYTVLPQIIRQDPLAAATLSSDPRFAAVVNWTVNALIDAEQLGVTQANVDTFLTSTDPRMRDLVGERYGTGTLLGLDPHWAANVIHAVGNYGEMFRRDLGAGSPLRLDRGENRLWTDGGLMYALPLGEN